MPLPRTYFDADLLVDDQLVEVRRARITHGDELRAELECHKQAIAPTHAVAITSVQLWCALTRLGHYDQDYRTFKTEGLVEYRLIRGDELGDDATVPPTREAVPSGPASPSLPGTPVSPTGSTPTSTSV